MKNCHSAYGIRYRIISGACFFHSVSHLFIRRSTFLALSYFAWRFLLYLPSLDLALLRHLCFVLLLLHGGVAADALGDFMTAWRAVGAKRFSAYVARLLLTLYCDGKHAAYLAAPVPVTSSCAMELCERAGAAQERQLPSTGVRNFALTGVRSGYAASPLRLQNADSTCAAWRCGRRTLWRRRCLRSIPANALSYA